MRTKTKNSLVFLSADFLSRGLKELVDMQQKVLLIDSTSGFVVIPFGILCLLYETFQSVSELTDFETLG
jgi:hypothetical protein